jgi:hypothetical protein
MDPHAGGENKSWLVTMAGEDGPIAAKYGLWETPSASYLQRTAWYVRDSDGTAMSPELACRTSREAVNVVRRALQRAFVAGQSG